MADLQQRLESALAANYKVERLLGQGGMAQVFLAKDLRHGRLVAVKVFLPEVAHAFGTGRFVREIRTAANLSHPNILALYDSGAADGLYYYVMPYVDGESLASRIVRDGPLPIDEALAITRQVANALQHAHDRGIVHRDIKPGNILLSRGNAFVADFGIAQALEETGAEKLTSTGFALGTPAYMSPEQSGGYGQLDGRADIYSLGCVLYEMLVGEPPFGGRSAQAILARHSVERVPSARAVRETVPWAVEQAIHRAMAKMPADRFATADEFAAALAPDRITQPIPIQPATAHRLQRRWVFASGTLAGVALLVLLAVAPWSGKGGNTLPARSPDLVAVLSFQAGNPADTQLTRLAGELPALIAERLSGVEGPRVSADSARAGLHLNGQLVGAGNRLTLSARLVRVPSGQVVGRVDNLMVQPDSLGFVLDRLVVQLVAGSSGVPVEEAAAVAGLPLSAAREFLAARRAYFRGEKDSAARHYADVLRADSSFLPAALGLSSADDGTPGAPGLRLAQSGRARLDSAGRLYLDALDSTSAASTATIPGRLAAWGNAVVAAPDRAERWFQLGEQLFHVGPWTGLPDVLQRARGAFRRALELEPGFVPAAGHLIDLAASAGDSADVRALGKKYFALDSVGDLADYYHWRVAVALGDQRELRKVRARLDSLSQATLQRIVNVTQFDGVALDDGLRAAEALWSRSGLWSEMRWGYVKRVEIALNRGRPGEAAGLMQRWIADHPFRALDRLSEVVNALFWGADTTIAAREIRALTPAMGPLKPFTGQGNDPVYDVCAASLWSVSRSELARVRAAISALRRAPGTGVFATFPLLCASVLETQLAAAERRPDLRERVEALDSLVRVRSTVSWLQAAANLTAARYWEELNAPERALIATRRRLYITDIGEPRVLVAQTTLLREEGRLAAKTGDKDGAIRAYRKYLALRADAEPLLAPQVARVRATLDSLERAK